MATLNTRIKLHFAGRARGAAGTLALCVEAMEKFATDGDWTGMAHMVAHAPVTEKSRIKSIIEYGNGVTFKADKKQPTGLRAVVSRDFALPSNRMGVLAAYVNRGAPINGKLLSTGFEAEDGTAIPAVLTRKELTPEEERAAAIKAAERAMDKLIELGIDPVAMAQVRVAASAQKEAA